MSVSLRKAAWSLALLPLGWLGVKAWWFGLGANPIEAIIRFQGDWALRFLLLTLCVTPLLRWYPTLAPARRTLGLLCFFFALSHLLLYLGLEQSFDWGELWKDIVKRRYITVGMLAFLLLIPLAVTSTNRWVKRLGFLAWKRLHRLVWPIAFLACLHFAMMIKFYAYAEPLLYTGFFLVLLGLRFHRKA
ncbi:Sulfoxide reductase heme-binding subunit YedZ [Rhodospirillaceae bacterium LM-1]|nr:Sulfoxide reductase heme-binding subunit YedZ [Rhodospirillaceae bacterium LM-1]